MPNLKYQICKENTYQYYEDKMNILAKRIIEYLKTDSTLTTALGSDKNIMAAGLQDTDNRKTKAVYVSTNVGMDGNNIPMQEGTITLDIAVSRTEAGAFGIVADLVGYVDDALNKKEDVLTNSSWSIIHFKRVRSPSEGILVDDKANEFYMQLEYEFILDESS